jgi:hypothetical protein
MSELLTVLIVVVFLVGWLGYQYWFWIGGRR